jgi:transposase
MSKKNQKYQYHTAQYKEAACRLVTQEGYSPRKAAASLGIPESTLVYWLRPRGPLGQPLDKQGEPTARGDAATGDSADPKALQIQIRELEAKVRRLEMEKEILKKATAFFASQ